MVEKASEKDIDSFILSIPFWAFRRGEEGQGIRGAMAPQE